MAESYQESNRELLKREVYRRLGGGMVDIELTNDHYEDAISFALSVYRQRSSNSTYERFTFMEIQPDQNVYFLPESIAEVRQIFRYGTGGIITGQAADFEPFAAAVANQTLLGTGSLPSLTTFELFTGFQKLVATMFGFNLLFTWQPTQRRLEIARRPVITETVMLWVYEHRPDDDIIIDPYARPWIVRYVTAQCKIFLGEARNRFGTFVGPQGGTSLNGSELKQEGLAEIELLIQEVQSSVEQNIGLGFIFG